MRGERMYGDKYYDEKGGFNPYQDGLPGQENLKNILGYPLQGIPIYFFNFWISDYLNECLGFSKSLWLSEVFIGLD